MGRIAHQRGKCIAKVGHLNIYQKNKQEVKDVDGIKKERTVGTEISIYNGKAMVAGETGIKNKSQAIKRAEELMKAHIDKLK
ncbi:MAG TPA: hypothetical protein VN922_09690 [Bacteroidia bacterium]|nr:hypothetical protein [Bacteroidia bacterium]